MTNLPSFCIIVELVNLGIEGSHLKLSVRIGQMRSKVQLAAILSLKVNGITLMAPDSSIRSMEKSFPEPVDLFHVLTSPLLVTLALMVHLFCHSFNMRFPQEKKTYHDQKGRSKRHLVWSDAGNGGDDRSTSSCGCSGLHH